MHFIAGSKRQVTLTDAAWNALERYRWPGNVRELQNVVEQLVCRPAADSRIDVQDLPRAVTAARSALLPASDGVSWPTNCTRASSTVATRSGNTSIPCSSGATSPGTTSGSSFDAV
jgi:transcriptional regulator with PAS, ATPase and Fis domain